MKLFILSDDMSGDGPVWMNIFWPHYTAYKDSVPTVLMNVPFRPAGSGRLGNFLQNRNERRLHSQRLCDQFRAERDPKGPNILVVWGLNVRDIIRSRLLDPVWDQFDARVLWILDTVNPAHVKPELVGRFDLVACICGDTSEDFKTNFGLPTVFMPPHTDVLRHGSTGAYRPIDLLVIGRRLARLYNPIHLHFNQQDQARISCDLMTRTRNFSASAKEESQLLLGYYARAKLSFCFEPSTAHPRFRSLSPMTERWPHSWASGCTVVGTRPRGRGAAEQMDWPEAMIELPETPNEAIPFLEALLADEEGLRRRRVRNVAEAARRHDSRHRLHTLIKELDMAVPDGLANGLKRLEHLSSDILAEAT